MDRAYEPWPDDEQDPTNVEEWGWWDETPFRREVDGPAAVGNVPTAIFDIMWDRNPANRRDDREMQKYYPDEMPGGRWLMWDDRDIAVEELQIALTLAAARVV